ncbi:unnamed protein product [Medioppia subpectinata]|uniref:Cytochrome P450 n=1 Tax=Medioppia subpectinata TaxID=1979941 RepID=A0A7R9QCT8_9ACAR|nr:unnamed protein product [Medioppia subpectinata]CAG2118554.1 unnamed protein product [Medioppia subpectinata]
MGNHYMGTTPIITIGDPKLIKDILVKDFHVFTDRSNVRKTTDANNADNLFRLTGDDWKRVRSIISPAFSSGKMRQMFPRIRECMTDFVRHLDKYADPGTGLIDLDVKHAFGCYTMDVIATCAFGIKANIYSAPDSPFLTNAVHTFDPNPVKEMATLLLPPRVTKWVSQFYKSYAKFYIQPVREVITSRLTTDRQSQVKYNDFIQLLMDAEKEGQVVDVGAGASSGADNAEGHHVNEVRAKFTLRRKYSEHHLADPVVVDMVMSSIVWRFIKNCQNGRMAISTEVMAIFLTICIGLNALKIGFSHE